MTSTTISSISQERVAARKLWWVGPLTIIVAALANLLVRTIAVMFFGVSDGFRYFQAPVIISSTALFLLLAFLAFILVGRFARRPVRFYRILALVALLVSFLNPALALAGLFPVPGMTTHIFWTMIIMHCVAAIITVSLLTTLAVEPSRMVNWAKSEQILRSRRADRREG
jgi:uncharacterized membrane protein YozB (DUF420 family)